MISIRDYFSHKRTSSIHEQSKQPSSSSSCDPVDETAANCEPLEKKHDVSVIITTSKKLYKAKLSYKKKWEIHYAWLRCPDSNDGMFCNTFQKYGNAPARCRGAWTTRGLKDWNHATELLKQHMRSQWHRDVVVTAAMAEQAESGVSVLELQCSSAAWEVAEQ